MPEPRWHSVSLKGVGRTLVTIVKSKYGSTLHARQTDCRKVVCGRPERTPWRPGPSFFQAPTCLKCWDIVVAGKEEPNDEMRGYERWLAENTPTNRTED